MGGIMSETTTTEPLSEQVQALKKQNGELQSSLADVQSKLSLLSNYIDSKVETETAYAQYMDKCQDALAQRLEMLENKLPKS
jgi:hypothetical protein